MHVTEIFDLTIFEYIMFLNFCFYACFKKIETLKHNTVYIALSDHMSWVYTNALSYLNLTNIYLIQTDLTTQNIMLPCGK